MSVRVKRGVLAAVLLLGALPGCVPVLVGGLIYKSSKTKEQKRQFMDDLQRTNAERHTQGLPQLDWCSEAYRFDKGWAVEDKACEARVKRYEAGDTTALDPPGGRPAS